MCYSCVNAVVLRCADLSAHTECACTVADAFPGRADASIWFGAAAVVVCPFSIKVMFVFTVENGRCYINFVWPAYCLAYSYVSCILYQC